MRLVRDARAVGRIVHSRREAAAPPCVALIAPLGGRIQAWVVAESARICCRARWSHVDAQCGLRIHGKVDAREATALPILSRIGRRVRRAERNQEEVEIHSWREHVVAIHSRHVDVPNAFGREQVGPITAEVRCGHLGMTEVKVEALADARREWRGR